jgi:hypothetical protein
VRKSVRIFPVLVAAVPGEGPGAKQALGPPLFLSRPTNSRRPRRKPRPVRHAGWDASGPCQVEAVFARAGCKRRVARACTAEPTPSLRFLTAILTLARACAGLAIGQPQPKGRPWALPPTIKLRGRRPDRNIARPRAGARPRRPARRRDRPQRAGHTARCFAPDMIDYRMVFNGAGINARYSGILEQRW